MEGLPHPSVDEQTPTASQQTLAGRDQSASGRDQNTSERDRLTADSEEVAGGADLALALDDWGHDASPVSRQSTTSPRSVHESLKTAVARDIAGQQRDLDAHTRDRAADLRDRQAREHDELSDTLRDLGTRARISSGRDVIMRAGLDRQRAAEDRALAAEQRVHAAQDREHSARERLLSARDRAAAVTEQQLATTDDLAAVLHRRPGLAMLRRDVDRAHRANGALTAVFIDIDALTATNDTRGHRACHDRLLHGVASTLVAHVRPYDLVIAVGGDEFVCTLGDVTITGARARLNAVQQTLLSAGIAISVGYGELTANDTPATLIDRAHADMLKTRTRRQRQRPPTTPPPAPNSNGHARQP